MTRLGVYWRYGLLACSILARYTYAINLLLQQRDNTMIRLYRPCVGGAIVISAVVVMLLTACSQNSVSPDSARLADGTVQRDQLAPIETGSKRDFAQNVGDIVYFTTNSSDLTPEARETLMKQVSWLNRYKKYTVKIEGHADERGTREYNIALGARRASAVRDFLSRSGIDPRRVQTVSFGKERPVAVCNDISCWSQNRRAQTVLSARAGI